MERNAILARTRLADDQTHVNRLRAPRIGIVKLSVSVGGKASRSHLPDDAPPPAQPDPGTDDFHFVPEKETAKISYEIADPFAIVDAAKLEIFGRFDGNPLWALDLKTLGEDWYAHGKHEVTWDGRIVVPVEQKADRSKDPLEHDLTLLTIDTAKPAFPDGYLTLEHTPYKVKLTIASQEIREFSAMAWTYVQILIKSIEIEIAPEECVPATVVDDDRHKRDKAVRNAIAVPAADATTKVFLPSDLYKTSNPEMNNNTAFSQYETLWGEGPNIPLLAKIRLADSTDAEVKLEDGKGAVALGKVKFLWDWQDPDEDVAATNNGKPKDFIDAAIDYYKHTTEPKGDNCHKVRGGKRGPDAKAVFPACDGYAPKDPLDAGKFPFKVEACTTRTWAAYSYGWTKGRLSGQTGALFQPSRMAGDDYVITVYLAYDKTGANDFVLDNKDQPLAAANALKMATGRFQIWREIHVVRYIRKKDTIKAFAGLAEIQAHYRKAYIELKDNGESYTLSEHRKEDNSKPDYGRICGDMLQLSGQFVFTAGLAVGPNEDHSNGDSMFIFRKYMLFVFNLHANLSGFNLSGASNDFRAVETNTKKKPKDVAESLGVQVDLGAWVNGDLQLQERLAATRTWLRNNGMATEAHYSSRLNKVAPYKAVVSQLQTMSGGKDGAGAASDGITIVHFDYLHSVERDLDLQDISVAILEGVAVDAADATRNRCAFVLFQSAVPVFVHEIGHHLFLPHARGGDPAPTGIQENRHDIEDLKCIMSYSQSRETFCGLCQLRLRGWDADQLDNAGLVNTKL